MAAAVSTPSRGPVRGAGCTLVMPSTPMLGLEEVEPLPVPSSPAMMQEMPSVKMPLGDEQEGTSLGVGGGDVPGGAGTRRRRPGTTGEPGHKAAKGAGLEPGTGRRQLPGLRAVSPSLSPSPWRWLYLLMACTGGAGAPASRAQE